MTALSSADEPKRFETINFRVVSRWRRLFHVLEIEEKKKAITRQKRQRRGFAVKFARWLMKLIWKHFFFRVIRTGRFCYETSASMGDVFLFLQVA